MTDRPIIFSAPMIRALLSGKKTQTRRVIKWLDGNLEPKAQIYRSDRLWVREAFSYDSLDVDHDGTPPPWFWADGNPEYGDWTKPKPSIHMPRCLSRLTLTVTEVRVQRLQEISEEDAKAEGVPACARRVVGLEGGCSSFICGFQQIWHEVNDPPRKPGVYRPEWKGPGSWHANPYVACSTFSVEQRNIDA